jgi:hypothetical protein
MLTTQQEDEIVKLLSSLTPMEYSSLIDRVRVIRSKWSVSGFSLYSTSTQNKIKK